MLNTQIVGLHLRDYVLFLADAAFTAPSCQELHFISVRVCATNVGQKPYRGGCHCTLPVLRVVCLGNVPNVYLPESYALHTLAESNMRRAGLPIKDDVDEIGIIVSIVGRLSNLLFHRNVISIKFGISTSRKNFSTLPFFWIA